MSASGISATYTQALAEERDLPHGWVERFNEAMALYFDRVSALRACAPDAWFSPRLQNLCIVTDPDGVRPYVQPFADVSMLLYASDFDPALPSAEFGAYMLVHSERLCQTRRMAGAVARNLSYFLPRTREQTDAFAASAAGCTRPDAPAFQQLAAALPWIRRLHDARIKPVTSLQPEPFQRLEGTDVLVPQSVAPLVGRLLDAFDGAAAKCLKAYFHRATTASRTGARDEVCAFVQHSRPNVVVVDGSGRTLWERKDAANLRALRRELKTIGLPAARSLIADLDVIGARTDSFLAALREPEGLPRVAHEVEQEGGIYLDAARPSIVYALSQPGISPLQEPAPPFHRWLVAARTIHEWGHLAADAGWVGVPVEAEAEHAAALAGVGACFERIVAEGPALLSDELAELGGLPTLLEQFISRMSDYASNVLARRFLRREELEAYVRNNVRSAEGQQLGALVRIMRYAYEFQYLHLSAMANPLAYFLDCTWFRESLVADGLVKLESFEALLRAAGELCACTRVDQSRFVGSAQGDPTGDGALVGR